MLTPGARAPAFALPAAGGAVVSLKQFRGTPVVLYFYPKDDTATCTVEACEFRDRWRAVRATGAVVLGVSPDPVASHQRFAARYKLPFPLLADTDHAVAAAYGVWGEKSMYGRKYFGILRTTFVINGAGKVVHVFEKVKAKGHAVEVLAVLRALKV